MRSILRIFSLLIILLSFNNIYSQNNPENPQGPENQNTNHEVDTFRNVIVVWNLSDNINESLINYNDSSYTMFHQSEKDRKYSILSTNLGEITSAYISDIFIDRHNRFDQEFIFIEPYKVYLKNSGTTRYFNSRRPYTSIKHTTSTKINNIQTIDFTHTQNVHPNLNFAVNFDFISSQAQQSKLKKTISTIELSSNYRKNRYNLYFSYIYNKINNGNSGGYDFEKEEPTLSPLLIDFNANTLIQNQEISVTNKYKFGKYKNLSYRDTIIKVLEPTVSLSHNAKFYRNFRKFTDSESSSGEYYDVFRFQDEYSSDSSAYKGIINEIMLSSEKKFEEGKKFGFNLSVISNINQYYNFKEYILLENSESFFDNSVAARFFSNQIKNNIFKFNGTYYFSGYRKNDMNFDINYHGITTFQKFPDLHLKINFQYTDKRPSYFLASFYSNHYSWNYDFLNVKTTRSSLSIEIPKIKTKLSVYSDLISNYIYYKKLNNIIEAVQHPDKINIISAKLEKNFIFKRFEIHNQLIGQRTSNDSVVSIPEFAAYHSTFLKFILKNSMHVHFGYDVYFSTKYKAKGFDPAVGMFHIINDSEQMTGEYPYINIFANIRIKRNVILFFKFEHANAGFYGDQYPAFISNYPMADRVFRFGVKWKFTN